MKMENGKQKDTQYNQANSNSNSNSKTFKFIINKVKFKIQRSKTRKEKNYGKRLVAGRKDKTKDINKTRSNLYHYYCI